MTKYIARKYIRQTSIDAYNEIKAKGLLSKRRMEVYSTLYHHGPLTANEVFKILSKNGDAATCAASNSAARFSELREMGVICEVQVRKCSVTGMNVIEWDVTPSLPRKVQKKKKLTKNQKKEIILNKLVAHGKKQLPVKNEDVESYKNELREIYVDIKNF